MTINALREAMQRAGVDALWISGPANVRAAEFLPYAELFARTDVFVTNGGYTGVTLALAHGVPIVQAGTTEEKAEIAAINAPEQDQSRLGGASAALDAIVRSTEQATSDILGAAEEVQELAWTLRENGVDNGLCDQLDRHATQIYTACSFQDITGQRISKVVAVLKELERATGDLLGEYEGDTRPDAHLLNGPAKEGEGIDQAAVDALFG